MSSMPREESIACRSCGKEFKVTMWESVDTRMPNAPMRLMTRDLFRIQCPHCGHADYIEYDILYDDMEHNCIVCLVHNEENWDQAEAMFAALGEKDARLRIVQDSISLAEKVTALEYGRDDRLIELCKIFVCYHLGQIDPYFEPERVVYCIGDDENEYLSFLSTDGEETLSPFDDAMKTVYAALERHCLEKIEAECADRHVFDLGWAYDFFNEHEGLFA